MNMLTHSPAIRLLLVDDDRIDRLACRSSIEKSGHPFDVVEAETAEQGLRLVRHESIDCIVLDHDLPDFGGLEFLADLLEEQGELSVPVVILTRASDASVAVRALKLGASDYVVKDSGQESLEWIPAIILKTLRERKAFRDQRKIAADLHRMEAKYRNLVEQIPAITYIASIEQPAKLLYVSPQAERLGYPIEAWLKNPDGFLPWVHPDDLEQTIEQFATTHEHHTPLCCEYRLLTRDGQTRWFLDTASVVHADDKQALFFQGTLVDITENKAMRQELRHYRQLLEEQVKRTVELQIQGEWLKAAHTDMNRKLHEREQAEAAIRANAARYRLLLESAGEGILGVNAEGRCTFANKTATELFGCFPERLEGRDMLATLDRHRKAATNGACPLRVSLRRGTSSRFTETLQRRDGRSFTAEFSVHPIQPEEEPAGLVILVRDVSEARAPTKKLSYEASHDALTGLLNRVEFERRVAKAIAAAQDEHSRHALCLLDLDHFKRVNDSCGRAAGDQLLQSLGRLLESRLRQSDTLARLEGDKFGLLLEHCAIDRAWVIANELRETIRTFRLQWGGEEFSVGMSVGIVALNAASGEVAAALSAADTACCTAKKRGRDRVHILESAVSDLFGETMVLSKIPDKSPEETLNRRLAPPRAASGTVAVSAKV